MAPVAVTFCETNFVVLLLVSVLYLSVDLFLNLNSITSICCGFVVDLLYNLLYNLLCNNSTRNRSSGVFVSTNILFVDNPEVVCNHTTDNDGRMQWRPQRQSGDPGLPILATDSPLPIFQFGRR